VYLSSLILNPRSRNARHDLADVYEMHRTVMRAFADRSEGGAGSLLWRVDQERRSLSCSLLVQSSQQPDWSAIQSKWPNYFSESGLDGQPSMRTRKIPEWRFQIGQELVFRLRANPTVKRDGNRHGLQKEDAQLGWIGRKASQHGFSVTGLAVIAEPSRVGKKGGGHKMTFVSALFTGRLQVTDPLSFRDAVGSGIGTAKAFGFGLLSLARG